MTQRTVDVDTTKNASASDKITPAEESRAEKKARRAEVYDRGMVGARLHVDLPAGKYGEWVPNDTVEIHRKRSLGFEIDNEYAKRRALHDKGDGASYVGDCVFMVCDKEDKEILDELRKERYDRIHVPKSGKQKEEKDFLQQAPGNTVPAAMGSVAKVRPQQISDALKAASNQS